MNILEFTKKYNKETIKESKTFIKDWEKLLKKCQIDQTLTLCFHTLLEEYFPFEYLKKVIEYDEKGKESILNDENTFKWACAFGHRYLIVYLNDKVKEHNIIGAIGATFRQYRVDNLQILALLGYEKEIYTEPNLCQAISRANQSGCSLDIVEYLFERFEKFPTLSNYVFNELEKQDWLDKIIEKNYITTFCMLLNLNSEKFNKDVIDKTDDIIINALRYNNINLIEEIMSSPIKEKFIEKFNKNKNDILKEYLFIDKNKNVIETIIEKYPELLKHNEIKLWMMNNHSLTINELIEKNRKIPLGEMKKAIIQLSKDEECFDRLLKIYPDMDYKKFSLQEIVKISNNLYENKKHDSIDYSYDGDYMQYNRKILLGNKDFKEYEEEIREVIYDEKMYNLLYKEHLKNNLEEKLGHKPKMKKMKI